MLLGAVVLAVVAGGLLARPLSGPLAALSQAARRLAHGDSAASLPKGGASEIRELVATFGEMRDRLGAREAEKGRLLVSEREARARAEAAVRTRDLFLSVAAHELKTPITSLRGYSQLLLRQLHKGDNPDPARLSLVMTSIDQQSQRLTSLVNQLLDISRIDTGKLTVEKRMADIPALVEGVVDLLQQMHPERTFAFTAKRPTLAAVDSLRLEQVITNLLDNAVKFSPVDSPIEVAVGIVGMARGQTVTVEVRDHGPGMPVAQHARIFERYYQAHGEWHGGLGLGLFISQQIVELHGGTIAVDCPADGGSRFVVRLPADIAQTPIVQTGDT
jgi:signal transduction histidine kinase